MLIRNPFAYLCFMTQQELTEEEALLICWMRKKRVQAAEMMVMARLLRGVSAGMAGRLQCVELGIKEWKAMKKDGQFFRLRGGVPESPGASAATHAGRNPVRYGADGEVMAGIEA